MDTINLSQAMWRKSSRSSANGQCAEVAFVGGLVALRDSKNQAGAVLLFAPGEWEGFVGGIERGEFTRP